MPEADSVRIRRFTQDDIAFGMQLKTLAGWNQLPEDWERFIAWEPGGCFLASYGDEPAGTAICISYEDRFGWIGMVLVHPDMRRRGIGRALLMACVEYLETVGVAAVKLDATPMGKQLYDTIGFHDEYILERHTVIAEPQEGSNHIIRATPEQMPGICELDLAAFGADRSRVLHSLQDSPQTIGFVAMQGATPSGYVFVRPGTHAHYVGPWVACDPDTAEALLRRVMNQYAGQALCVDISLANTHTSTMVARHGLEKQRHLIRMYRGTNTHPGDTGLVYGVAGPEIG